MSATLTQGSLFRLVNLVCLLWGFLSLSRMLELQARCLPFLPLTGSSVSTLCPPNLHSRRLIYLPMTLVTEALVLIGKIATKSTAFSMWQYRYILSFSCFYLYYQKSQNSRKSKQNSCCLGLRSRNKDSF